MEGGKLTNPSQAMGWSEVALHPHLLLNSFPSPFWLSSFPSLLPGHPLSSPLLHLLSWQLPCEPVPPALSRALLPPYQLLLNLLNLSGCPSSWAGGALPPHQRAMPRELSGSPALLPSHLPPGGIGGAQLPLNADGWKGRGNGGAAPRRRSLLALSLPRGGTHRQRVFSSKMVPVS